MEHIFKEIDHLFGDVEIAGILVVVLILSLIVMNIVVCVCVISMRKSLKRMADGESLKKPAGERTKEKADEKREFDRELKK